VLGFEPGAEGERGQAERRAGQRLGRAQRFHPRKGHPGALAAGRGAVEHACPLDAEQPQRRRRGEAAHAGADDSNVGDRPALRRFAQRHPRLARQFQALQIPAQPRFEVVEAGRAVVQSLHASIRVLRTSAAGMREGRRERPAATRIGAARPAGQGLLGALAPCHATPAA
jgi:hypothetical protein